MDRQWEAGPVPSHPGLLLTRHTNSPRDVTTVTIQHRPRLDHRLDGMDHKIRIEGQALDIRNHNHTPRRHTTTVAKMNQSNLAAIDLIRILHRPARHIYPLHSEYQRMVTLILRVNRIPPLPLAGDISPKARIYF